MAERIPDPLDLRSPGEEVGDPDRRGTRGRDAERQRLHPLEQHPGIERREGGAGVAEEGLQRVLDPGFRSEHGPAEHAPLAVEVLGRRIDDDVGAERERLL